MTLSRQRYFSIACGLLSSLLVIHSVAAAQELEWARQIGSDTVDEAAAVSLDGLGHLYTTGFTFGYMGDINAGEADVFIAKYDTAGVRKWTRQFGSDEFDQAVGVSADGLESVYVAGFTNGKLAAPVTFLFDAFLTKYDDEGLPVWTRQLGSLHSDFASGVSADRMGNVYMTGYTNGNLGGPALGMNDAFVAKHNDAGTLLWSRHLGTAAEDQSTGIATDALGSVFIGGFTEGILGGPAAGESDGFVTKYDASGNLQWTRQFGTSSEEEVTAITTDGAGNVYLAGRTEGDLGGASFGADDAFVAKFNSDGDMQWITNLGTPMFDWVQGIATDQYGNAYVTGRTNGGFGENAGGWDAFVSMVSADGAVRWSRNLGTSASDGANGIDFDDLGNAYLAGYTDGSLQGSSFGSRDVFVAKINIIPEPSALSLTLVAPLVVLVFHSIRPRRLNKQRLRGTTVALR